MLTWAVQENLDPEGTVWKKIKQACKGIATYRGITSIPFDDDLPDVPPGPVIFYGATRLTHNISLSDLWTPGVYFDRDKFHFSTWRDAYGKLLINNEAEVMKLKDVMTLRGDDTYFIRPANDLKEFPGSILDLNSIQKWVEKLSGKGYELNEDADIVIGEAYNIKHEWRLFIVDGKVSSGSHYRTDFRLDIKGGVPEFVEEFVEKACEQWVPAPVFVMDIGLCGGELYIIEINCFNSSGFYGADIGKIIFDITKREKK